MGLHPAAPVAGLGRRSAAYIVDSLIVGIVYVLLAVFFDAVFGPLVEATPDGTALVVVAVDPLRVALELAATLVIDALYFAGSWSRWGASPAQRVLRLRVRMANGTPTTPDAPDALPIEAAWRRWAVLAIGPIAVGSLTASGALDTSVLFVVNGTWFLVLFISAASNPLRRGLHDRVAGTVVVPAPVGRA
jgi:uncharacterized RDD family membrane protein YckC